MGKTILHFFSYDMTVRVGRPGVSMKDGNVEQDIDLPRIAPAGFYREVDVGDTKHLYYHGIDYEPINDAYKHTAYRESWELTSDEEVFEY